MTVGRSENSDDLWIGEMGLSARNGKTVDRRNWKWIGEKWDRSEKRVQKTHHERRLNRSLDRTGSERIGVDRSVGRNSLGAGFEWIGVSGSECGSWADRSERIVSGSELGSSGSEWCSSTASGLDRERIGVDRRDFRRVRRAWIVTGPFSGSELGCVESWADRSLTEQCVCESSCVWERGGKQLKWK